MRSTTRYRRTAPRTIKRLQNARRKVATRSATKNKREPVPMSPQHLRGASIEWNATPPPLLLAPAAAQHPVEYPEDADVEYPEAAAASENGSSSSSRDSTPYSPGPVMKTPASDDMELDLPYLLPRPCLTDDTTSLRDVYTESVIKEEEASSPPFLMDEEPVPGCFNDTVFTDNALLVRTGGEWHHLPWPSSPARSSFEEEYTLIRDSSCSYSDDFDA